MATIDQIRQQYPQYSDLSDAALMAGIYNTHYSDMPVQGFIKTLMTDYGMGMDQIREFSNIAQRGGAQFGTRVEIAPETGGGVVGSARGALQGMTLGAGDELVAGGVAGLRSITGDQRPISDIYSQELERERQRIGQFRQESPVLAYGSEFAGGAAIPLAAANSVRGAAAIGGGTGAAAGFLTGEGGLENRATGAVTGGVLGALLGAGLQAGAQGITNSFENYMTRRAAKAVAEGADSIQQLRDEANAAYTAARNAGVQIDPQEYEALIQRVTSDIAGGAGRPVRAALTPKSADVLSAMEEFAGRAVGIDDLEYLRQLAQTPAGMVTDKAEQRAASLIISGIDDFMGNLTPAQVVSNPNAARGAVQALQEARDLWGRMRRTERIQNIIDTAKAGGYAGGFESGLKTQIGTILRNPKQRRGFSEAELKLLSQIQLGTPLGRVLAGISYLGFSPSGGRTPLMGGGLMTGAATGGLAGGPIGALIGAGVEATSTTLLRAIREKSLEEQARLYAQVMASGRANEVAQQFPEVLRYLASIASRTTTGAQTQMQSDILSTK